MKYIIIISLFFLTIRGIGQEIKVGQRFTFKAPAEHSLTPPIKDKKNDIDQKVVKIYNTLTESPNYLESGIIFKIMNITNEGNESTVTVMVDPPFSKKDDQKAKYYNYKLFYIPKMEVLTKMEDASQFDLPDRFNIGILTLPFKFRFLGNQSFESDFNINSTLSVRCFTLGNGHAFAQFGAGIGGVELTDVNAKGIVDKSSIKANALSMMVGFMIQYKKIQAGVYLGVDYINNQTFYQWEYQGKPWVAFGVGYQLFNVGLGQDKPQKNQ